ncbi:putative cellulase [Helianthus annuus]|uniref:Cellulase n=1 Tax=Helianthus annuus TaxID=4232 RepID=A0A9K3DL53_HELAN|nr:putative cellulase [Helianthus annuus]
MEQLTAFHNFIFPTYCLFRLLDFGTVTPPELLAFGKSQVDYILGYGPRAISYMDGYRSTTHKKYTL